MAKYVTIRTPDGMNKHMNIVQVLSIGKGDNVRGVVKGTRVYQVVSWDRDGDPVVLGTVYKPTRAPKHFAWRRRSRYTNKIKKSGKDRKFVSLTDVCSAMVEDIWQEFIANKKKV